jgi:arylsulfatase A-like enzyme
MNAMRAMVKSFCLACLALGLASLSAAAQTRRPNFVFILVDDMGYGDLSSYGAPDIRTPHIDRLAREGVKLTDCYSNGPVCTPTRAAFITGRYQQRVGLEWAIIAGDKKSGLPVSETSIARMLKNKGYATALIGKWHLGSKPEFMPVAHGFDEFFGITGGNVDLYSHKNRLGEHDLIEQEKESSVEGYLTDHLAKRSVEFIRRKKDQPFFLYLAFNAVHWPFQPPGRPDLVRGPQNWIEGDRAIYKAMMENVDAAVGSVLKTLDEQGLAGDTMVIFTSDNGGERLSRIEPFFNTKGTLWEGGIRTPGLIRYPAALPKGKVSNQPAITMDWTATMLAAAGVQPERPLDGIDLLPILQGKQAGPERALCWRIDRDGYRQKAIRAGKWKLVLQAASVDVLLFDLERDPSERLNLFYQHQDIAQSLRAKLNDWEKEMNAHKPMFVVK